MVLARSSQKIDGWKRKRRWRARAKNAPSRLESLRDGSGTCGSCLCLPLDGAETSRIGVRRMTANIDDSHYTRLYDFIHQQAVQLVLFVHIVNAAFCFPTPKSKSSRLPSLARNTLSVAAGPMAAACETRSGVLLYRGMATPTSPPNLW